MTAEHHKHPLAIDLLAYTAGDLDDSAVSTLKKHLPGCLLCRIQLGRIRRHGIYAASPPPDTARPSVSAELLDALDPEREAPAPATGQVWLAGRGMRVLVWVRAVTTSTLIVHPVTIDINQVDDTALIVDVCPTLDEPVAIVTSIVGTVAADTLVAHLGDLPVTDLINSLIKASVTGITTGLRTGLPITCLADERLEFRQLLADDIVALDPIEDDDCETRSAAADRDR